MTDKEHTKTIYFVSPTIINFDNAEDEKMSSLKADEVVEDKTDEYESVGNENIYYVVDVQGRTATIPTGAVDRIEEE